MITEENIEKEVVQSLEEENADKEDVVTEDSNNENSLTDEDSE
jgi:hypothetical protein